jgi:hypothetical protein
MAIVGTLTPSLRTFWYTFVRTMGDPEAFALSMTVVLLTVGRQADVTTRYNLYSCNDSHALHCGVTIYCHPL